MDWTPVYDAYPVNREQIWLNNCGTVPAGDHVLAAVHRYLEGYARHGHLTETATFPDVLAAVKTILSRLLGCRPEELALIHNTAEGMNIVSHGLDLAAGDEIVLLENEFPSNVYPWLHWREKGVRIRTAPMGETPDGFLAGIERLVGEKTRVVAVSAVHWCTGMPLPLERIGALCRDRGIVFVVDGAQGVGMQPLDVDRAGIAFMAFPAWKWLMGPLGLGVLYVREERIPQLKPVFVGTASVVDAQHFLPYKSRLQPTADRFVISTANFIDWVYFRAALEFLDAVGFDVVRGRLMELGRRLADGLDRTGWRVLANGFPDHPTAIVVCEKPGLDAAAAVVRLHRRKVVCAERLGRVRLSPHVYNSPEQLDRVVDLMARL